MKTVFIVAIVAMLCGCAARASDPMNWPGRNGYTPVTRWHDPELPVTCWSTVQNTLSCLPDSQIKAKTP